MCSRLKRTLDLDREDQEVGAPFEIITSQLPLLLFPPATTSRRKRYLNRFCSTPQTILNLSETHDPINVLYVDDSIVTSKLLRRILQNAGYNTDIAYNGREALNLIQSRPKEFYSIIISDIDMPVMNGIEFVRELNTSSQKNNSLVVVISANTNSATINEVLSCGIDLFVQKPMSTQAPLLMSMLSPLVFRPLHPL